MMSNSATIRMLVIVTFILKLHSQEARGQDGYKYNIIGNYSTCLFIGDSIVINMSDDGRIDFFDVFTNTLIKKVETGISNGIELKFENEKYFILSSDSLFIFDNEFNQLFFFSREHCFFSSFIYYNNEVVLIYQDGFFIVDIESGNSIKVPIKKDIMVVRLDENGELLFLGCNDGSVVVYDTKNHKIENIIPAHKNSVTGILIVEPYIITSSSEEIKVCTRTFDVVSSKKIKSLPSIGIYKNENVYWLDDSLKNINIWNIESDSMFYYHTNLEKDEYLEEKEDSLLENISSINILPLKELEVKKIYQDEPLSSMALSVDESILMTGNRKGMFSVIFTLDFSVKKSLKIEHLKSNITIRIRPDNQSFFIGTSTGICGQYDINTGKVKSFERALGFGAINSANYSPEGEFIQYTSSTDQGSYIRIDNTGKEKNKEIVKKSYNQYGYIGDTLLSFSSLLIGKNKLLVSKLENIVVFNTETLNVENVFSTNSVINSMAINNDKSLLFVGDTLGYVKVVDIAGFNILSEFKAHSSGIISIKSKDNSDTIITCSNSEIKLWNINDPNNSLWGLREKKKIVAMEYLNSSEKIIYITSDENNKKLYFWKKESLIDGIDEDYKKYLDNIGNEEILPSDYMMKFISNEKGTLFMGVTNSGKALLFTPRKCSAGNIRE